MADVTEVKTRAEADPRYCWDTAQIFSTEADWEAALSRCQDFIPRLSAFQGKLGADGAALLDYLRLGDELSVALSQVYCYASLRSDEDAAAAAEQERVARAQTLAVELSAANAFAAPELNAIPDETLEGFYAATPGLETYRVALDELRRRRAHILSEREEVLLAAAGELGAAPMNIFDRMEGADLRYPDAVDAEGQRHPVTHGGLSPLLQSPDRVLRCSAFRNFYQTWLGMQHSAAALMQAQHRQLRFFAQARRYGSSLEASLDQSNVPTAVYDKLVEAVNANLPRLHRYMALRKRRMGLEELHMYDLYASIVPEARMEIPYEQAKELVLEALSVLGEDYVSVLRRAFDARWIDVYENRGKRSGAYSCAVAGVHPYVLLNHKDDLNSVFTLAHELGHTMHSYLSEQRQPRAYADYVIFVAEVASTVNEALLMQYLLRKTEDRMQRAYLLNYFLEQFRATIYRQTMFAQFEQRCGEIVAQGGSLTAERLGALYADLNRRYYGPDVTVDPEIAVEWARIPHFYLNYYVYQYATGFSAAMAISRRILREGAPAVEDYLRFLSSGSSLPPVELLKLAGADMTTAQPVNAALEQFGELIGELEELLEDEV